MKRRGDALSSSWFPAERINGHRRIGIAESSSKTKSSGPRARVKGGNRLGRYR